MLNFPITRTLALGICLMPAALQADTQNSRTIGADKTINTPNNDAGSIPNTGTVDLNGGTGTRGTTGRIDGTTPPVASPTKRSRNKTPAVKPSTTGSPAKTDTMGTTPDAETGSGTGTGTGSAGGR